MAGMYINNIVRFGKELMGRAFIEMSCPVYQLNWLIICCSRYFFQFS